VSQHPYRPSPSDARSSAILAGPNRLRTAWHLLLTTGLIVAAGVAFAFLDAPALRVGLGIFAAFVGRDLARTIHEAVTPHHVLADARGLELSWATPNRFSPWVRRQTVAIGWDELGGVEAETISINGVATTDLRLTRHGASPVHIPHATFSPDGTALQERILDELHGRRDRPARDAARVAEYCRHRYEKPVSLRWHPNVGSTVFLAILGAVFIAFGMFVGVLYGSWVWLLAIVFVATGAFLARIALVPPVERHLRLDARGVWIGPDPTQMRCIEWDRVLFARPHVINGTVVRLRVAADDDSILLFGDWGIPLDTLGELIDPPRSAVTLVHELVTAGTSFDDAQRRAGLHPRSDSSGENTSLRTGVS
jgi:hypothetical protein